MASDDETPASRYDRQMRFRPLGADGQRKLRSARALIVGVGGLGSWIADLLARAGVGFLRLVDADRVDWTNLHRQDLYDESDAAERRVKSLAAARRLARINRDVVVEAVEARVDRENIAELAAGVDAILDGTDNFATRFLINDYAVKVRRPWVFAGVLGAEGQVLPIVPGRTPCLRCLYETPPATELTCRTEGVLGPAVASVAALAAAEAMKILAGQADRASPFLTKLNLWDNTLQRMDVAAACQGVHCVCCKQGRYEFLQGAAPSGRA